MGLFNAYPWNGFVKELAFSPSRGALDSDNVYSVTSPKWSAKSLKVHNINSLEGW